MRGGSGDLGRSEGTAEPDADNESFRILVLTRIRLTGLRVMKEPAAPQTRLVYIHLHLPGWNSC